VPGRVSTEVDARLSFDAEGTVAKARHLIDMYKEAGYEKERVLIKVASTWEGVMVARQLEQEGIHVNMTLIFNKMQAAAAAEANATLISPFVGRITDFYKEKEGVTAYAPEDDPGVKNVRSIYNYFKHHDYKTVVMGASFRNKEQILSLAGCDLLTVAPSLLSELAQLDAGAVTRHLDPSKATAEPKLDTSQSSFLWSMNEDDMAHFKLAEGIRKFTIDLRKLESEVTSRI
jgi:transaldolase